MVGLAQSSHCTTCDDGPPRCTQGPAYQVFLGSQVFLQSPRFLQILNIHAAICLTRNKNPNIQKDAYDKFLFILFVGNLDIMSKSIDSENAGAIEEKLIVKFSQVFGMEEETILRYVKEYSDFWGGLIILLKMYFTLCLSLFFININYLNTKKITLRK